MTGARIWPGVAPNSGNHRVLELLSDRKWHTTFEMQVGLEVFAHSRLSELRDRGYVFDKRRTGQRGLRMFEWRLLSSPLEAVTNLPGSPASVVVAASSGAATDRGLGNAGLGADGETQSLVAPLDDLHSESTGVQPDLLSLTPAAAAPDRAMGDSQLSFLEAAA